MLLRHTQVKSIVESPLMFQEQNKIAFFVYITFILWPDVAWLTVFSKCGIGRCRSRCTVSSFKTSTTSILLPTLKEKPTKCQWPWCRASLKVYSIVWFIKVNDDGSSLIEAKELSCHPVVECIIGQWWGRGINAKKKKKKVVSQ